MKKCLAALLCAIMLAGFAAPALAAAACPHLGNTVKTLEAGHIEIEMEDGYRVFCVNYGDHEADEGDQFTVAALENMINNQTGAAIAPYLQALFAEFFAEVMEIDPTTYDVHCRDAMTMQCTIWHFSDNMANWRVDEELLGRVKSAVAGGLSIPAHGYRKEVLPGITVEFNFHYYETSNPSQQNFFGYKIDVVEVEKPAFGATDQTVQDYAGRVVCLDPQGENMVAYQWQVDTGDGSGFNDIADAVDPTFITDVLTTAQDGHKYRCIGTGALGETVTGPVFTLAVDAMPKPVFEYPAEETVVEIYEGEDLHETVTVKHAEVYRWQSDEPNDDKGYIDLPGELDTPEIFSAALGKSADGVKLRCIAGNASGETVGPAFVVKIKPAQAPVVPGADKQANAKTGDDLTLEVQCDDGAATYQWQVDKGDGAGFVNEEGAAQNVLKLQNLTTADSGYRYRCVVTNPYGSTNGPVTTLKVVSATGTPNTGDAVNVGLYAGIMCLSLAALALLAAKPRKGRK